MKYPLDEISHTLKHLNPRVVEEHRENINSWAHKQVVRVFGLDYDWVDQALNAPPKDTSTTINRCHQAAHIAKQMMQEHIVPSIQELDAALEDAARCHRLLKESMAEAMNIGKLCVERARNVDRIRDTFKDDVLREYYKDRLSPAKYNTPITKRFGNIGR